VTAALRPVRQVPPRWVGAERLGPVVLADHPLCLAPGSQLIGGFDELSVKCC